VDSGLGGVWWAFALVGAGAGLCLTPMTATAVSAVEPARAGMASAIHNALRQLGQVLGVAVLGALVFAPPLDGARGVGRLRGADADAFVHGLHAALLLSGVVLLGAAALVAATLGRVRGGPRG
jgi:DHA2 family methylenomycin A resistance protein-like MFS transporter